MAVVKPPANPDYGTEIDIGEKVIAPTNNARQGIAKGNVRTILFVSTLGVIVAFGIAYLAFFS